MLAALLLLAAQDAPDDIVVTGKLLRLKLSVQTNKRGRATACGIDRTSGDAAFDRAACEATVACSNRTPRDHDAVSSCVRDGMRAHARAHADQGTEERE